MKRKRYTEEQVAFCLRQHESGTPVSEIVRKMGITEQTFYRWKKQYAGLGVAEVRRLKQLEEENQKLKQLVADLSLDKKMLQDVLSKKPKARSSTRSGEGASSVLRGERAASLPYTGVPSCKSSLPERS